MSSNCRSNGFSGSTQVRTNNGWLKKVALLTLLMPNPVEACRGVTCCDCIGLAVLPVVVMVVYALCTWRALSPDGAEDKSFITVMMVGPALLHDYVKLVSAEIYFALFLLANFTRFACSWPLPSLRKRKAVFQMLAVMMKVREWQAVLPVVSPVNQVVCV